MISVHEISKDEVLVTLRQNVSPEQAAKAFREVMRAPHQKVTIDCAELAHMDHKILGKLYMLNMDLQISKRSMVLAGCSEKIRSLLHLTKIDERIEITEEPSPRYRV
jgi:anti-anti-sigma regulatory factor